MAPRGTAGKTFLVLHTQTCKNAGWGTAGKAFLMLYNQKSKMAGRGTAGKPFSRHPFVATCKPPYHPPRVSSGTHDKIPFVGFGLTKGFPLSASGSQRESLCCDLQSAVQPPLGRQLASTIQFPLWASGSQSDSLCGLRPRKGNPFVATCNPPYTPPRAPVGIHNKIPFVGFGLIKGFPLSASGSKRESICCNIHSKPHTIFKIKGTLNT